MSSDTPTADVHSIRFRKLRIVWSVAWGVACLLVLLLWGRSYTIHDVFKGSDIGVYDITYESQNGHQQLVGMDLSLIQGRQAISRGPWFHLRSMSADLGGGLLAWNLHFQSTPAPMFQLTCPHWFVAVATGSLAAMPWIRRAKRFSLRSLFIATTFVALVLGLIMWLSR